MKPMLASDWSEDKVKFPVIGQPKVDGVRALNLTGALTGRSLKTFGNRYVTQYFSQPELIGFDGEMAAQCETHPDLCRLTTSAMASHEGEPFLLWHCFDYITEETKDIPYRERLLTMDAKIRHLQEDPGLHRSVGHLRTIPWVILNNMDELLAYDEKNLDEGFEGTILRDPCGKYKQGRSTAREGGLLRIKRFLDFDCRVLGIEEGYTNGNAAQINELGKTFRSTHQSNMVANGMVGALNCQALEDVFDGQKLVIQKDQVVKVSAGSMPHSDRDFFFKNQNMLLDRVIKAKFFPKGIKDKPRFPTYVSLRLTEDLVR